MAQWSKGSLIKVLWNLVSGKLYFIISSLILLIFADTLNMIRVYLRNL